MVAFSKWVRAGAMRYGLFLAVVQYIGVVAYRGVLGPWVGWLAPMAMPAFFAVLWTALCRLRPRGLIRHV